MEHSTPGRGPLGTALLSATLASTDLRVLPSTATVRDAHNHEDEHQRLQCAAAIGKKAVQVKAVRVGVRCSPTPTLLRWACTYKPEQSASHGMYNASSGPPGLPVSITTSPPCVPWSITTWVVENSTTAESVTRCWASLVLTVIQAQRQHLGFNTSGAAHAYANVVRSFSHQDQNLHVFL